MTKHIRALGEMRTDKRFKSQLGRGPRSRTNINKAPTLCGKPPTPEDFDVAGAKDFIVKWSRLKPEWVAEICPDCVSELR
jgi:hypothetical protein